MAKNNYSLISSLQLAKICGVSQGTVDRALNNRPEIKKATKERILEAAKKYGYIPNLPSAHDGGIKSKLYGIVLFNLYNDFFSQLIMDLEEFYQSIGYNSIIMFSHNDLQKEIGCINQLVHLGVEGIVLCSVGNDDEYSRYLLSQPVPIVTVGNKLPLIPFVGTNDFSAMQDLVAKKVKDYPNADFYYFAPALERMNQENVYCQIERHRAFCETLDEKGIPHATLTKSEKLLESLMRSDSAVVICATDYYALQLSRLVYENKLDNVKITGFDNCSLLQKLHSNIDSVGFDRKELVNTIHKTLLSDNPSELNYIPHHIVSHKS